MAKPIRGYWRHGVGRALWWTLVTAPLWLIGVFILVRDGLLSPEYRNAYLLQFLPAFRPHWYCYVIVGLVYLIVVMFFVAPAANRAILRTVKQRHRKSFRRYRERLGAHPEQRVLPLNREPSPAPNLVSERPDVIEAHEGYGGIIMEGNHPRSHTPSNNEKNLKAIIVPYRNKIREDGQAIGWRDNVSAQIIYTTSPDGFIHQEINRATWLSEDRFRVKFEINSPHILVTAILQNGRLYSLQENAIGTAEKTKRLDLHGHLFSVCVNLVSEDESKIISTEHFMLEMERVPMFKVTLTRRFEWKRTHLADLAREGINIRKNWMKRNSRNEFDDEFQGWLKKTADFLLQHWGADYRARFLSEPQPPHPRPTPSTRPAWASALHIMVKPLDLGEAIEARVDLLRQILKERFRTGSKVG